MRVKSRGMLPWVICTIAAIFYCYEYLLRVTPSVMMPELMQTFHLSAASLGVLSSFYYYAYTPMQLPVGMMIDRFGPRRILTIAVICCALGAFVFGTTESFWQAAFGRALMGFGSAFAFVGVLKLATIWLPPNRFAFIAGLATTLGMVGAISGELLLSRMVSVVGWQNTVLYSSACGFLLVPLMWWVIRDTTDAVEIPANAPQAPPERLSRQQFFAEIWSVVSNRQVWLVGSIGGLLFLPITVFAELWGNEYLKALHNISVEQATIGTSLIFAGWAVGGPIIGAWSDSIKSRKIPLLLGSVMTAASMSAMMLLPDLSLKTVYLCLFLTGFFGGAEIIVFAVARENCSLKLTGTAVSMTNFLIMLGGAVLQPAAGKIIQATWTGEMRNGYHVYSPESYQLAMLMIPAGLLLAFVLSLFLKETHCNTQ